MACAVVLSTICATGFASTTPQTQPSALVAPAMRPAASLGEGARLSGEGRFSFMGLRIYDARLWVGASFDARRPTDAPFALELTYARAFDGKAIAERSVSEIAKIGLGSEAERDAWLAALARMMPNVAAGDRLVGLWRPGEGMTLLHNDRPIARSDDFGLARAFFSIWLHPKTSAPGLRRALLAGTGGTDGSPGSMKTAEQ